MGCREELLHSIRPGMRLTEDFFKRIYADEITWPGFAEKALQALEVIGGYSDARSQYTSVVSCIDAEYEKGIREAGAWYVKECEKQFEALKKKRGEEQRKKQYLVNSVQNSSLQQQREKLMELKKKLRTLN